LVAAGNAKIHINKIENSGGDQVSREKIEIVSTQLAQDLAICERAHAYAPHPHQDPGITVYPNGVGDTGNPSGYHEIDSKPRYLRRPGELILVVSSRPLRRAGPTRRSR